MQRETDGNADGVVRFRPSRVEGVLGVDEVCISCDALELIAAGERHWFPFLAFAPGREIATGRVPVGELHFSKSSYPDSHFVFYTTPRIVIFMPSDGPTAYPHSHFWRVQEVLREGGFRLYEDGPPKRKPTVLDPCPARTLACILAVFAFAWLYALAGFLPQPTGGAWRQVLLSNPHNPSIGVAFILPATAIPMLMAFRHGRTGRAFIAIMTICYMMALISEWLLRRSIHSWAALELPPYNMPFWSVHRFASLLIAVIITGLIGWSWRRGFLEPIAARRAEGPDAQLWIDLRIRRED